MKRVFYLLSLLFVTVWITGFFIFKMGGLFHSLLVIALLLYIRSFMLRAPAEALATGSTQH
jgi:hypothetical protein